MAHSSRLIFFSDIGVHSRSPRSPPQVLLNDCRSATLPSWQAKVVMLGKQQIFVKMVVEMLGMVDLWITRHDKGLGYRVIHNSLANSADI